MIIYTINFELNGEVILPTAQWKYLPRVDDVIFVIKDGTRYTIVDIEYNYDEYSPTITLQLEVATEKPKKAVKTSKAPKAAKDTT